VLADSLSPHRPEIDHEVELTDGEILSWGPLYSMSRAELVVLKEWPEENMSKGTFNNHLHLVQPKNCSQRNLEEGYNFVPIVETLKVR
jgi:hypothetical protein